MEDPGQAPGNAEGHGSDRDEASRRDPPTRRIETAHARQPPGFIIIGTQRGGTTSLYRYLTEHPDIGRSWRKEVHYFDRYYDKGEAWYLAHFPKRGRFPLVGEASPSYLFHPKAPERVSETLGNVRFIVLLRNPVDRGYSQYQMKVKRGVESLAFGEALDREPERLGGTDDRASLPWRHYSYIQRSLYADQLERWLAVFSRERFLILKSEDFYAEPVGILHEAQAYLGVDPHTPAKLKAYNPGEYLSMDPGDRQRLAAYFAPHNRRLYELIGRDLGWEDDS